MSLRHRHRRRRAAFTLLELMVALTVGGIAISSIYAIGASSTQVFRVQNNLANIQHSLRMAMSQVKRDIARAGYLSTPNVQLPGALLSDQVCGQLPLGLHVTSGEGRLAAFSRYRHDVLADNAPTTGTALDTIYRHAGYGAHVDDVVMFANYATSDEYPILRSLGNGDRVVMQHGFYEFQRDFTEWSTSGVATFSAGAFDDAFMVGRAVRIQLPNRKYVFDTIAEVIAPTSTTPVVLRLTSTMGEDCQADLNGAMISPLNAIRYHVRDAPDTGDESNRFESSGPMAQLVRSEVDPLAKTTPLVIPNTNPPATLERSVLDYVVQFELAFQMTASTGTDPLTGLDEPDQYTLGSFVSQDDFGQTSVNTNPQRVRAVTIDLAVRTPEQDSAFPWLPTSCAGGSDGPCCDVKCFQVFTNKPGAARVRKLHAEVFVPNVASEGY